ncbi:molybdopterin-dependent oxidoreductase [Microbispora sp. H11081]|uniref:molybdopterin oxidoreductase family protein n=1 Tax=Microbispora sp. H11081 TaxID=2729107 RepID=UPI00289728EE|nr:molybdopterin-dependent oxidoreductase [Microbispora sp. H11081]
MLDRIADPRRGRTPYGPPDAVERLAAALPSHMRDALPPVIRLGSPWPVRVDVVLEEGLTEQQVEHWAGAVSAAGWGDNALDLAVRDGRVAGVRGRAGDRVNHGRLDPREWHAWQPRAERLTRPLVREGGAREDGRLVEATWETAMDRVAARSRELLARPGGWGRLAFHTGTRLFLEEHYTLAVIGKAGIGTPHMDGDTRWGAAAAAAALAASFGADGQPGSYTDVDHCDALALWGHDCAASHPVLWERMLDRRSGPAPPAMIAIGPEGTAAAGEADVHLAVRPGTNVALLNGLLHELIAGGWHDAAYVAAHTVGFERLWRVVEAYPAKRAAEICGVPVALIEQAAEILGAAERLVSTVGQAILGSNQATEAACQVNNVHLLRGMLGRPGAGLFQFGGPGCDALEAGSAADLPGLRNWADDGHVRELADLWNVDPAVIPHWGPATHAGQILRYAEEGSLGLLWITASDPAATMPGLDRVLGRDDLFVVVQDPYLTETARLADVVLPAAAWGEKTGTVTGADRTVHLCEKAVEPPGEARADLDILLDYARRMGLRDRDGRPLVGWTDAESAFEAWKACTRGRPCDHTGISYERLRAGGIQWPCAPSGTHGVERLYAGGHFATGPGHCQTFGADLATGAEYGEERYRAEDPGGRAFLHAADFEPSPEVADDEYPLVLTTRRALHPFPGRLARLGDAAAPEPFLEVHPGDAAVLGVEDGDLVRVESPLGVLEAVAHLSGVRPGAVVLLLDGQGEAVTRAAEELTLTAWDAVSRRPLRGAVAVRLVKAGRRGDTSVEEGLCSAALRIGRGMTARPEVAAATGGGEAPERYEEF